ncbi:MAG: TonB-dependent receptor plug domain-containing protein [Spirochaetes bacterium]|nr:TonB-dependent receptor plug domain-containing protein [Spirochaetota bacterium]
MKKLFFIAFCLILMTSLSALNAQEVEEETNVSQEEAVSVDGDDAGKSKTQVFDLGQVVVKSKRIADIESATTTTTVSALDIEARAEKTLDDTLQMIPGVATFQHAKGHRRFKMRGYDMDKVAILIDGIPLTDVYDTNIDISKISIQNASEITINRGTSSVLYGTSGTIGSINIVTQKPTALSTKAGIEYGLNGDYTLNAAHGMPLGDFYYWVTANVQKEAPYDVSKKLSKSERRKWYDKFMTDDLGYPAINLSNSTVDTYLNETGEWPGQESMKYNLSLKSGYNIWDGFETGLSINFSHSKKDTYTVSLYNTEEYDPEYEEWDESNRNTLNGMAFTWPRVTSISVAPYTTYENGDFYVKGNIFYSYNYEILDAYTDPEHESVPMWWGGVHSNWQNTITGFNVFPSYKLTTGNKLNGAVLFRYDKHLEREKAMGEFIGTGIGNADAAYNNFGDSWFDTKLVTGTQITLAVEDEITIKNFNITAGISYDAQKLNDYKVRESYTDDILTDQYKAEDDSTIWGTRDSFNPVISAMYEPLKDFLILRTSFSQKTKLPTMAMYSDIENSNADVGLKPEKSQNLNAGIELFFMNKNLSVRTDYFYTKFKDKLESVYIDSIGDRVYTNIDGVETQGIELITGSKLTKVAGIIDMNLNFSYVFVKIKNLDTGITDTELNKGEKFEDNPEHQFIADIRLNSVKTNTSLNIFGSYTANAIKYAMKSNPDTTDEFSTSVYKEVKLHNPLMFNVKLSQKFMQNYEAYILVKNIFDDYAADPFNPGPGRQFYFGAKAEI